MGKTAGEPPLGEGVQQPRHAHWSVYSGAYHAAGRLRDGLDVVERGRRVLPDAPLLIEQEIRMRAALGQVSEVNALLDRAFTFPGVAVSYAITAAREYGAHGHPAAAAAPLQRALEWLASRPPDERETPAHRYDVGRTLYWGGRWQEALPLFEALARDEPSNPDRLGYVGTTLARLARRDDAVVIAERLGTLKTPYMRGTSTLWRGRIRAALGDSADAVRLLRQAINEGRWYPLLHGLPELEVLTSYGPLVELVRPRE